MFTGVVLIAALLVAHPALADDILVLDAIGNPIPLAGQIIQGDVFIFFTTMTPDALVQDVGFFIDGAQVGKANKPPYELNGSKPFDTLAELADGPHALEAVRTDKDGVSETFEALFFVDNASAPVAPTKGLQVVTATADVDAGTLTLEGFNFDRGAAKGVAPRISLDLFEILVTGSTSDFLTAVLPAGLQAGDHLVHVSTDGTLASGLVDADHAELLLTIGATDLTCVGCVSDVEVNFPYAGSATPGGKAFDSVLADSALFAQNADLSDGLDSTAFSPVIHGHPSLWGLNGSSVFYNGGNVGIGTMGPLGRLHAAGSVLSPTGSPIGIFRADSAVTSFGADFAQLEITNANQTANDFSYISFSENTFAGVSATAIGTKYVNHAGNFGDLFFWTRGSSSQGERLYITSNVGIGTRTPSERLHVVGNIFATGSLTATSFIGDGSGLINLPPGPQGPEGPIGPMGLPGLGDGHSLDAADGSPIDALFVDNLGNVGIGTTNPGVTLDVAGAVRSTLTVAGTEFQFAISPIGGVNRVQAGYSTGPEIRFLRTDDHFANVGMRGLSLGSDFNFPTITPPLYGMIVEGKVGIGTPNPTFPLHMASGAHVTEGGVWTNASSRALKTRIKDLPEPEALDVSCLSGCFNRPQHLVG